MCPIRIYNAELPTNDDIAGRTAHRNGVPWIVPEAFAYLEGLVKPAWRVFEWGAGGSTIWFAHNCTVVVTVENSERWYQWAGARLEQEGHREKADLLFVEAGKANFDAYVDVASSYPDASFDCVSVDGIYGARSGGIAHAVRMLKPGGVLLLDNTNHYKVPEIVADWSGCEWITPQFQWLGKTEQWATRILFKPEGT